MPQCWLGGDGTAKSLYLGTKLIKHDLTFSPQPSPAISWIIRGLNMAPQKKTRWANVEYLSKTRKTRGL